MTNCCGHCLKGNKNMVMFADIYIIQDVNCLRSVYTEFCI